MSLPFFPPFPLPPGADVAAADEHDFAACVAACSDAASFESDADGAFACHCDPVADARALTAMLVVVAAAAGALLATAWHRRGRTVKAAEHH